MSSIAAETPTVDEPAVIAPPALSALDRCDHCGAQAYHRVTLASGELLFCAHHGRELRDSLIGVALHWQDETDRLQDDPRQ